MNISFQKDNTCPRQLMALRCIFFAAVVTHSCTQLVHIIQWRKLISRIRL